MVLYDEFCESLGVMSTGSIDFEGRVVPIEWFTYLCDDQGNPDFPSIFVLCDIVYWYRPYHLRNQDTGKTMGYGKKFKGSFLKKTYQYYLDSLGLTIQQVLTALSNLESRGLIECHDGEVPSNGALFIELFPDAVQSITSIDSYPSYFQERADLKEGYPMLKNHLSVGSTSGPHALGDRYPSFKSTVFTDRTRLSAQQASVADKGGLSQPSTEQASSGLSGESDLNLLDSSDFFLKEDTSKQIRYCVH